MFSLLKSAIKKDTSSKNEANGNNLDDFFSKGAGKNESDNNAIATNATPAKSNSDVKALRSEFRASEYGLVIRDLDQEREALAKNQSALSENEITLEQQDSTSEPQNIAASNVLEASNTVEDGDRHPRPASRQQVADSIGKPLPRRPDTEGQELVENEDAEVTNDAAERKSGEYVDSRRPSDAAPSGQAGLTRDDEGIAPSSPNQDATQFPLDEAYPKGNDYERSGLDQPDAIEDSESPPEDLDSQIGKRSHLGGGMIGALDWAPRDLNAEVKPPGSPDGSEKDGYNDETASGDDGGDFDGNVSDQEYEDEDEANVDAGVDEIPAGQFDADLDNDEAQTNMSQGSLTPTSRDQYENDEIPDLGDEDYGQSEDNYSNPDETQSQQEDDIEVEDEQSQSHPAKIDGEIYAEADDQSDDQDGPQMAESLQQDEEALDQVDRQSDPEDSVTENDLEELDHASDRGDISNGEDFMSDAEERNSHTLDDPSKEDQSLCGDNVNENEDDVALEGDDGSMGDEGAIENDDLDGDVGLDGDDDQEEEDDLEAADDQSIRSGSAVEEELSDVRSDSGSQHDMDESGPENPLAVNGREWTEAHMEAFRINVRSKANIFDFLARRGVLNRERVSEVVAESLKLCLRDTTALRGKTHATVFMEAGGTPLGPFLAFLALTVQSTMNSSKDETKPKDSEEEGEEEVAKPKHAAPAPPAPADDGDEEDDEDENDEDDEDDDDDEDDEFDEFESMEDLEAPPSHFEPARPGVMAPTSAQEHDIKPKSLEVATNIMVVMFLQAVLESSRAAISGPAKAYLEWTFISQQLEIHSGPVNCKDKNDGSLHEKRSKRTAAFNLQWEDVNPLEYVSIGTQPMYSKQKYVDSHDVKAQGAAHMISMLCERLRSSKNALSEFDRTTFAITSSATSVTFAYAVFTPEYIKHYRLEQGLPSTLNAEMGDVIITEEPELKMFESIPYDLSKWDEALEAAELALAMVEFLQKNGPLLASTEGDEDPSLSRGNSLKREKSTSRPSSAFSASGKRFPIKIRPQPKEAPTLSKLDVENEGEAENMSDEGQPTPITEADEEDEEKDVDGEERYRDGVSEHGGLDDEEGLEVNEGSDEEDLENDIVEEEEPLGEGDEDKEERAEEGDDYERKTEEGMDLEDGDAEGGVTEAEGAMTDAEMGPTDVEEAEENFTDGEGEGTEGEMTDEEGIENEGEDVPEEGSTYDEANVGIKSPLNGPDSPYLDDDDEANDADDQASTYDEDQFSPDRSPALSDHPHIENAEDEYVSGEEDADDDRASGDDSAEVDHASGEETIERNYLSGEDVDEHDNASGEDDAEHDYLSGEDVAEQDYESGEDKGEHNYISGEENTDDDCLSEDNTAEVDYISGDEHAEEKYLSGEDDDRNFSDDLSEAGTQAEFDEEEVAHQEGPGDRASFASSEEGDLAQDADGDFYPDEAHHGHPDEADPSEGGYLTEAEPNELSEEEYEGSIQGGANAGDISPNTVQPAYDEEAHDDEADEGEETRSIDEMHRKLLDKAFDNHSEAEYAAEATSRAATPEYMDEAQDSPYLNSDEHLEPADAATLAAEPNDQYHDDEFDGDQLTDEEAEDEDHYVDPNSEEVAIEGDDAQDLKSSHHEEAGQPTGDFEAQFQDQDQDQDQDLDISDYHEDHPLKPEHLSVIPEAEEEDEEDDDLNQLSPAKQKHHYQEDAQEAQYQPDLEAESEQQQKHYEHGDGDTFDQDIPDQIDQAAENDVRKDMEGIDNAENYQRDENQEGAIGEREPQYGDPVEGYLFDPETQQYYPLGEDGQPYLPQAEYDQQGPEAGDEAGDDGVRDMQGMDGGPGDGQYDGQGYDGVDYDGHGYDGQGYDGQGYDGQGYEGEGYGYEDEHQKQEQYQQQGDTAAGAGLGPGPGSMGETTAKDAAMGMKVNAGHPQGITNMI